MKRRSVITRRLMQRRQAIEFRKRRPDRHPVQLSRSRGAQHSFDASGLVAALGLPALLAARPNLKGGIR